MWQKAMRMEGCYAEALARRLATRADEVFDEPLHLLNGAAALFEQTTPVAAAHYCASFNSVQRGHDENCRT